MSGNTSATPKKFSLVPETAQQQMLRTISKLCARKQKGSGAEITEAAVALALGEQDIVLLACAAEGARMVRRTARALSEKRERAAMATTVAVNALMHNDGASVLICLGKLKDADAYREAFSFAAQHNLPILYLVANDYTVGKGQKLDLRTLYAEFGIAVFSVDANDAIAAYRVATEALNNARNHSIPCVIESLTVRGQKSESPVELLRGYMERHGTPLK